MYVPNDTLKLQRCLCNARRSYKSGGKLGKVGKLYLVNVGGEVKGGMVGSVHPPAFGTMREV